MSTTTVARPKAQRDDLVYVDAETWSLIRALARKDGTSPDGYVNGALRTAMTVATRDAR